MKKATVLLLIALLALAALNAPALAGEQGPLGRLTKLNVDEVTLSDATAESYFDKLPFSHFRFFDTLNSMVAALSSGSIAGIEIDEYTARYLLSREENFAIYTPGEAIPSYTLSFSMLLREEDAERRDAISKAIADMEADGTLDALKQRYIDDVIAGIEPEAVASERFDGTETFKVALTGDRPPMDYFSPAGEAIGFNTALVSEVGKRLGINVEFISVDTAARAVSLASGECDAVFWMEAGDFGGWEKADVEDQPDNTVATIPYLEGALTLVVLSTSPLTDN